MPQAADSAILVDRIFAFYRVSGVGIASNLWKWEDGWLFVFLDASLAARLRASLAVGVLNCPGLAEIWFDRFGPLGLLPAISRFGV